MGADLNKLARGDTITIKSGAYNISPWNDGKPNGKFASFVYNDTKFTVMQVGLGSDKGKRTNYVAFGISGQGYTGAVAVEDIKTVVYSQSETPVPEAEETKKEDTNKNNNDTTSKVPPKTDTASDEEIEEWNKTLNNANAETYATYANRNYGTKEKGFGNPNTTSVADQGKVDAKNPLVPRSISQVEAMINGGSDKFDALDPHKRTFHRTPYDPKADSPFPYPQYRESDDGKVGSYDYTIDLKKFWRGFKKTEDDDPLARIEALHGIPKLGRRESFKQKVENYFRFKYPNPGNSLTKGFAHVFFTRPDLNVLDYHGNGTFSIPKACEYDTSIYYAFRNNKNLLRELVADNGMDHDFMFLLSNAASSFSLLDEKIKTDEWAATWTGHKVTYGKHSNDTKSASTFSIEYVDDRNLNIYHLHKLWIDYIDKVYRGAIIPRGLTKQANGTWAPAHGISPKGNGGAFSYTADKVLDYACSVYYILTAEDGESIIFWSKYYGVFPTVAPSEPFGWTSGDMIKAPKLTIEYAYSFKQDYDPFNLAEFNWLYRTPDANVRAPFKYVSSYNPAALGAGPSRVGAPFIETVVNDTLEEPFQFKLRFRPVSDPGAASTTFYKSTKGMKT